MADELDEQLALETGLIEPTTVPLPGISPAETPVRKSHKSKAEQAGVAERRTRRTKAQMAAAADEAAASYHEFVAETDGDAADKPKRGRPSRARSATKLTGAHVTDAVVLASGLTAMLTKQPHWHIAPAEVTGWSNEAADLLNRIPAKYVKAVTDMNGYIIVGVGIYGCMAPRLEYSQKLATERNAARRAAAQPVIDEAERVAADVPWNV